MSDINIGLVSLHRDLATERGLNLPTHAAVLQVGYDLGSFELTLHASGWSSNPETMQEAIRRPLLAFAESLAEAARGPIQIPEPPRPETGN